MRGITVNEGVRKNFSPCITLYWLNWGRFGAWLRGAGEERHGTFAPGFFAFGIGPFEKGVGGFERPEVAAD